MDHTEKAPTSFKRASDILADMRGLPHLSLATCSRLFRMEQELNQAKLIAIEAIGLDTSRNWEIDYTTGDVREAGSRAAVDSPKPLPANATPHPAGAHVSERDINGSNRE